MHTAALPALKLSFDAVFYYAHDMERSIAFYRDTLGLPLVSRDFVARFDIDGVLFEIVPMPDKVRLIGIGNARLCLQVIDIHDAVKQLKERGVETTQVKSEPGGLLAFFNDPRGERAVLVAVHEAVSEHLRHKTNSRIVLTRMADCARHERIRKKMTAEDNTGGEGGIRTPDTR